MLNIKNKLLNHVYKSHFEHFHHLPSILSPPSSYPLIAMSHINPPHRLSPITLYIMLRRKLRLPVYPKAIPCSCTKHHHDIYGDHAFSCGKNSKKRAHNMTAKGFAETLSTDLIRNKMVLIPFTIDPWCRFGPMPQAFLTTTQHPPQNTFRSDRPNASTMLKWATTPPCPCPLGILTSADQNWKLSRSPTRRPFFGHSHTAPTPSIHTIQQLGLTMTHAFSNLIRNGIRTFVHPPTAPNFDFHSFIIPEDTYFTRR
jgi:hypothetical protein